MSGVDLDPVPAGIRLLHIGPHKTGTTSLQAAFHAARDRLAEQGVDYPGELAHSMSAVIAAATGRAIATNAGAATDKWQHLLEQVRASSAPRMVLSSEFFSDAADDRVVGIVDDLDRERLNVVVTLRSLCKILPSQWQQYVQNRMVMPYADWLEEMLLRPGGTTTPSFWRRHRHDELVERWAKVVGADRMTVVVVDEREKGMIASTFESLLGLRPGTLPATPRTNRSLTYAEVELLREFNAGWRERGWSEADYTRLVRFGAARYLQLRPPAGDEQRILTPSWAVDVAMERQQTIVDNIRSSGARVVGDLDVLLDRSVITDVGENPRVVAVPPVVAARLSGGLVRAVTDIPRTAVPPQRVVGPIEAAARARPVVGLDRAAPRRDGHDRPLRGLLQWVRAKVSSRTA